MIRYWLSRHNIVQFNNGIWPANSPDLNPVEHLWAYLSHKLTGTQFASEDALWAAVQSEAALVPPSYITGLYDSMPRRIDAVIRASGGNTRY